MANLNYLIYIFFGVIPSIIWLLFYLRKDAHPEPKTMVIKIFLFGALIAPLVGFIECFPILKTKTEWDCFLPSFFANHLPESIALLFNMILVVALIEEIFKYLVVRFKVIKNPAFDEPTDIMLYMIIAALGFAAVENILYLFSAENISLLKSLPFFSVEKISLLIGVLFLTFCRFLLPVFLHTLCSGTIGYFLAKSFFNPKQKNKLLFSGFSLAILLHGLFNFLIIELAESLRTINNKIVIANQPLFIFLSLGLGIILIGLAIFVMLGFREIKNLKSVCKI
jgi:RsiW-degrading membrane proteinase PrsW (M82 family)